MIEQPPKNEMSIESWLSCFLPEKLQEEGRILCRKAGYRLTATLDQSGWECLEFWLRKELGIPE